MWMFSPEVPYNAITNWSSVGTCIVPDSIQVAQETTVEPPTRGEGQSTVAIVIHVIINIIRWEPHTLHPIIVTYSVKGITCITHVLSRQNSVPITFICHSNITEFWKFSLIIPVLKVDSQPCVAMFCQKMNFIKTEPEVMQQSTKSKFITLPATEEIIRTIYSSLK